jgi:hypothetical protein
VQHAVYVTAHFVLEEEKSVLEIQPFGFVKLITSHLLCVQHFLQRCKIVRELVSALNNTACRNYVKLNTKVKTKNHGYTKLSSHSDPNKPQQKQFIELS